MFKIFNFDSKFYQTLLKFSELFWVCVLTVVCSIPLITVGASVTAMHKLLYKIQQGDSPRLTRTFFRAFRDNFKQSTLIWLLFILVLGAIALDYRLIMLMPDSGLAVVAYAVPIVLFLCLMCLNWVFVLQSRYQNTVFRTIKLSFIVSLAHPLQSLSMMVLLVTPLVATLGLFAYAPLVLGISMPVCGLLRAMIYSRVFKELEQPKETEQNKQISNGR